MVLRRTAVFEVVQFWITRIDMWSKYGFRKSRNRTRPKFIRKIMKNMFLLYFLCLLTCNKLKRYFKTTEYLLCLYPSVNHFDFSPKWTIFARFSVLVRFLRRTVSILFIYYSFSKRWKTQLLVTHQTKNIVFVSTYKNSSKIKGKLRELLLKRVFQLKGRNS